MHSRARATISVAALLLLTAGVVEARPASAILAYGKVGGLIPVSKLDPNVSLRLGGGYLPPVAALKQRLAVVLDFGYSQTSSTETLDDPRVGGASYSYSLIERDLNLFVGPQVFILDPFKRLVPYAAVGLDLHFLQSDIEGEAGAEAFGNNDEVSTKVGFALRAGVGYRLGPGLITGELSFAWAPLDHRITGDEHLGRLGLLVGYTAMLGL